MHSGATETLSRISRFLLATLGGYVGHCRPVLNQRDAKEREGGRNSGAG